MPDLPLLLSIGVYFLSAIGGVSIVKFLNYHYSFTSWWIFALLSRSTWVLSAWLHCFLQHREEVNLRVSRKQLIFYFLVATGLSLVEIINSFSMSFLPGSLYLLLKGSDVGWSMILSYFVLHKTYTATKTVAAVFIVMGIGVILLLDDTSGDKEMGKAPIPRVAIIVICLVGALLNSLLSVGTEAMLKQTLREQEDCLSSLQSRPPSKLLLTNSYSMWTSLFSFGLLIIPVSLLSPNEDIEMTVTATDISEYTVSIGICLALLGISRFFERLGKHFICVHDSAVTFSVVQAFRRWLGIYMVGLIFHEGFTNGMILGSIMSGIGFLLHSYKDNNLDKESNKPSYKKLTSGQDILEGEDDINNRNSIVSMGNFPEGDIELSDQKKTSNSLPVLS